MKNLALAFALSVMTIGSIQAQRKYNRYSPKKIKKVNSFFLEGGGNAVYGSVNYDRAFNFRKFAASIRIGVGLFPATNSEANYLYPIIPLEGNLLFGKKNHFIETGLGVSNMVVYRSIGQDTPKFILLGFARIGYRLQKANGMFLRVGFTPILMDIAINEQTNNKRGFGFIPWAGISIGESF
ncbi:hypothetical protein [Microscilla marina]|uniref:Uncharacterized protein n=1 Tax=Microscilla marina ATCC 23134 TaxID=313606 RepID=A1ZDD8_MICM2|nr:hypothetical protein [Microscilla marina]EAY31677.1 hypothetical protein M23134_05183 [Microscilla marina ATCC 23134]